jgi:hypothetical protein
MKYLPWSPVFVCLLLSACSTPNQRTAASRQITFALIGDVPYTEHAEKIAFPNMIEEINYADVAFTIHDGDIKNGTAPCSQTVLQSIYRQFQTFKAPLIYLFGDNEWTDCGRSPTNNLSQEDWLARLRDEFTKGDESLGQRKLKLTRQSDDPKFAKFREHVRWSMGRVLFVGLNLPGDANNIGQKEYAERNRAVLDWTRRGFEEAAKTDSRAIMLILQANPHFELNPTNRLRAGFKEFLSLLEQQTLAFKKPVVLVHGDSHYFRIDKPLLGSKSKRRIENFTRVETFGYPDVHWVQVTIDESDPNVFVFRQRIVEKNLLDHTKTTSP